MVVAGNSHVTRTIKKQEKNGKTITTLFVAVAAVTIVCAVFCTKLRRSIAW